MVGTSNSFPEALMTFRVSLAGSGPGWGATGMAGISARKNVIKQTRPHLISRIWMQKFLPEVSMSTPMGLTFVVDLFWMGGVGVATGVEGSELLGIASGAGVELSGGASLIISAKFLWTATLVSSPPWASGKTGNEKQNRERDSLLLNKFKWFSTFVLNRDYHWILSGILAPST